MASVKNAFSLLAGGGDQAFQAAKSKKKNKKKSQAEAVDGEAQQAAPATLIAAPAVAPSQPQTVHDAGLALEAAAVAVVSGERGTLAAEWTEQVLHGDSVYIDGSQLADFKQVLVESKALHLLLEGCLQQGASAAEAAPLAQLLDAVAQPNVPQHLTRALAAAAASLGQLAATDPLAPTPAAKRSAAAALALVLHGMPRAQPAKAAEAPASKLKRLAGELGRQEARLASTQQPKELSKVYASVLELLCGQLDVLRPGGASGAAPQAPALAAALNPLEELRSALTARLQEVQAPPRPVVSVAEQVAQAEAAHKKEDAAAAGRLSEVEGRIASLEAELAALKGEAGELRQRRAAAAQLHQHRVGQIRNGRGADAGASPAAVAAAVQLGLGAVDSLSASLRGEAAANGHAGSAGPSAGGSGAADSAASLGQQVVAAEVPLKLLGAMQQVVELNLAQLHELGGKARFFRERLDKSIKQGEQAAKLGLGDPKAFKAQRATAEKNVQEVLAAAEAAAGACRAAVAAYRERLPLMLLPLMPSFLPPPPEYLSAMEARAAEAAGVLAAITSGSYQPHSPAAAAAAAPPPAAAAAAPAPAGAAASAPQQRAARERPAKGAAAAAANGLAAPPADLSGLEKRLAQLEAENAKKDLQIAAMLASSSLDIPSPLAAGRTSMPPAMLSSPSSNKPVGMAAPIAPAPAPAAAPAPVVPAAVAGQAAATGEAEQEGAAAEAAAAHIPVISFSQALAGGAPQGNGKKPGRPRRA